MRTLKTSIVTTAIIAACFMAATAYSGEQKPLKPGVVAVQDGVEVTLTDIDAEAAGIPENDRAGFFDSPKRIENTIMGTLQKKRLAAEARAEHLDRDPAVKAQIELAINTALAKAQIEQHRKQLKLPDFKQLASEYYVGHKDEFVVKGSVTVEHVLIGTKNNAHSEVDAHALADKVYTEAKAHPDRFETLVEKYSDDPSKVNNKGRIENAQSPKMAHAFADAAEHLQTPNEISQPVKTEFGYHVLKLIERTPDRQLPFDEVQDRIVAKLKKNWMDAEMTQYTNEFRGKPLQANPDLVASLRTRYAPPGYVSPADAAAGPNQPATSPEKEQH
jgi:parvulin-like peptidyl-prolyl isomerase